jgi:Zn-dependent M28 family amino/carboxypeptidase
VVVLLECLRLLADRPLPRDVVVLFTAAEEIGQAGARSWAEAIDPAAQRIAGILNLDQVGRSRGATRGLRVYTRGAGIPLARRIRDLGERVSPELLAWRLLLNDSMGKSDHGPFLDRGLAAVSLVEGAGYYPWEDQGVGDRPEKLDYGQLAAVARLVSAIALDPDLPLPDPARPPADHR